jgi:periplasmic copper chaperone A
MRVITQVLSAVLALLLSASLQAQVQVSDAFVRASLPGSDATAAYMTIQNHSGAAVELKSVTTKAAPQVTMHNSMNHNGMLHMMGVASLPIPAHGTLALSPNGTHLMLEKVTAPLAAGTTVELVLHFADGKQQTVQATVRSVLDE